MGKNLKEQDKNRGGRIFCIGRNYLPHINELGNELPAEPVVFMKPASSLVPADARQIKIPAFTASLHHEVEIVVLIGCAGCPRSEREAGRFIAGIGVGLDLTARDVQEKLKVKGLPWEKAKSFDRSAAVSDFVPYDSSIRLDDIELSCEVNGIVRQRGNASRMIFPIPALLVEIARYWAFMPGDMVFTGTPEGVGPLMAGDEITISSSVNEPCAWRMV